MNKETEKKTVDAFFVKDIRDRAVFELGKESKRREYIFKLTAGKFRDGRLSKLDFPVSSHKVIYEHLKSLGAPRMCYVMSIDVSIDGTEMPLEDALDKTLGLGPVLISCIPGELAYFEEEQEAGAPGRYILKV